MPSGADVAGVDPSDPNKSTDARESGSLGEVPDRLVVGFCRLLRTLGLKVPTTATIHFAEALGVVGVEQRSGVYWAGRATLVRRSEDHELYDRAFAVFWEHHVASADEFGAVEEPTTILLDSDEDQSDDDQEGEEATEDVEAVRFSVTEVLTEKDFSICTDQELDELTRLMAQLRFTTHHRRTRRQVPAKGPSGRPDLRRSVQWALRHQGEPLRLATTEQATRPRRLVLLLDVSGSMETYARALIRFVHAAVVARGRVEAFAMGTRLTRITKQLSDRDPDAAIAKATPEVKDWAGGTRLGEDLRRFNDQWGIRGMARGAVVVVLSDGWDRGDASVLGEQMERLHRVTHELIWVNPLKATDGYAPLAAGMAAALPHLDRFVAGNNFRSVEELATVLAGQGLARGVGRA